MGTESKEKGRRKGSRSATLSARDLSLSEAILADLERSGSLSFFLSEGLVLAKDWKRVDEVVRLLLGIGRARGVASDLEEDEGGLSFVDVVGALELAAVVVLLLEMDGPACLAVDFIAAVVGGSRALGAGGTRAVRRYVIPIC